MIKRQRNKLANSLVGVLTILSLTNPAFALGTNALPTGGSVVSGSGNASISTSGNKETITQSTNSAIINWSSFNIGSGASVQFIQPSSSSVTLNRVMNSQSPSQIFGSLTANGNIMIINSQGIIFGKGSHVNVGGLIATSSDIKNSDFEKGIYNFDIPGNPNASIVNAGDIKIANGGLAALIGPNVDNQGLIEANLGKVQLGSGDSFSIDLYGDGLINLQASPALTKQLVQNSGKIVANGGKVMMTAAAAEDAVNSLVNMDGIIEADSVGKKNGEVVLYAAGTTGTTLVSGTISAQGKHKGQTGGTVKILADKNVGIASGAVVNASGKAGGGTIHVGGDFHGAATMAAAQNTVVQSGALLLANATHSGNGGDVSVWSNGYTNFAGTIQAEGGPKAGRGGFVETSGHTLDSTGLVYAGTVLLDPYNIVISGGATTAVATSGGNPLTFTSTGAGSTVQASTIQQDLNNGTSVDIVTGVNGGQNGDITLATNTAIDKSTGADATLTLQAANDIIFNPNVSILSTSGKLNVTLNADSDNSGAGAINMNPGSSIVTNGGNIVMGGGSNPLATAATGDIVNGNVVGVNVNNTVLNAQGGNISILGNGYASSANNKYGVEIQNGSTVETDGAGTITVSGTGGGNTGATSNNNYGVFLSQSTVSAQNGSVAVTGNAGGGTVATSGSNYGVFLTNNSNLTSTGSGSITVAGAGGGDKTAAHSNIGIVANVGTNTVGGASDTGAIAFVADTISVVNGFAAQTSGNVALKVLSKGTTVGVSGGAGTLQVTGYLLSKISAGSITIGDAVNTGNITANAFNWNAPVSLISGDGSVTFNGAQTDTAGNALTASAATDIVVNKAITLQDGDLTLQSDTAGNGGAVVVNAAVNTNGGDVTVGGGNTPATGYAVGDATYANGVLVNGAINADGGNVVINGQGYNGSADGNSGVTIAAAVSTTGAGAIAVNGLGAGNGGSGGDHGVYVTTTGSLIAQNGAIVVTGASQSTGSGVANDGVVDLGTLQATGTGAITVAGTAGTGTGDYNDGVALGGSTSSGLLAGNGGLVTVTGAGGNGYSDVGVQVIVGGAITNNGGNLVVTGTASGTQSQGIQVSNGGLIAVTNGNLTLTGNAATGIYSDTQDRIYTSGTGNLTAYADSFYLSATDGLVSAGTLTIAPYAATTMGVGTSAGGGLNLTDSQIASLTAPSLVFGAATNATGGTVTDVAVNTAVDFGASNVSFVSGGAIDIANNITSGSGTISFGNPVILDADADVSSTSGNISFAGTIDGASNLTVNSGSGVTTFMGDLGDTTQLASLTVTGTTDLYGNVTTDNGAVTFNSPVLLGADVTVNAGSATASFGAVDSGSFIPLPPARSFTVDAGTITLNGALGGNSALNNVSLISAGTLALPSITVSTITAQTTGTAADVSIDTGAVLTASGSGTAVVLAAAGDFVNNAGSGAIDLTNAGSDWQIFSNAPTTDTFAGLNSGNTAVWDTTYAGAPLATPSGDRYVFAYQPTLTFTSTNDSKTYGQNDASTVAGDYSVSGVQAGVSGAFLGDTNAIAFSGTPTVTSTGSAATASVAGSPYTINVDSSSVTALDGYAVASGVSTGELTVNPAALLITANNASMTYGGKFPTFSVTYSGFVNGQNSSALTTKPTVTSGTPANSNAGTYVGTLTASGAVDSNYTISYVAGNLTINPAALAIFANSNVMTYGSTVPTLTATYVGFVNGDSVASLTTDPTLKTTATSTSNVGLYGITASGAVDPNYKITYIPGFMLVSPALLTATITGDPTKVYNGTTTATLTSGDYTLSGFVNGQGATVTQTVGTYNSANVVGATSVTANIFGYVSANSGTLLTNYIVPFTATGAGSITPAPLTASIINNPTKYYDGTTSAVLASGDYSLSGFVGGQGATVTQVSGTYNSPNVVDATTVSTSLASSNFVASNNKTLLSNYTLPTSASGAGTINPATVTVAAVADTKYYDGTTASAATPTYQVTSSNAGLNDAVGANTLYVNSVTGQDGFTTLNQSYNSPNVVGATTVSASASIGANYAIVGTTTATGAITPAALTVVADDQSKLLGQATPTLTYSYQVTSSNPSLGETVLSANTLYVNSLTGQDILTGHLTSAGPFVLPGGYTVNLGNVSAGSNYAITYVPGTLNIISPFSQVDAFLEQQIVVRGGGRKNPNGTLLAIQNSNPTVGNLANLAPAAGGNSPTALADLSPGAGGNSGFTALIQCNDATPCGVNQ